MLLLLSSVDLPSTFEQLLRLVDTGPGHVATVITLFLMWAAGRAFFR